MGYLAETMRNYLLRLGWSHGDDETISTEQAIAWFNLENIGRSPARLDFKKLDNLNAHYIRQTADVVLADELAALLKRSGRALGDKAKTRLIAAMPGLKERAKTLVELATSAEFLFTDGERELDPQAEKLLTSEARSLLGELVTEFSHVDWKASVLEEKTRAFAEAKGVKLGQAAQPIRAALTGKTSSPPVFAMLEVLGRDESLARLRAYTE
jgi:glutamyl-tRNA synthetase